MQRPWTRDRRGAHCSFPSVNGSCYPHACQRAHPGANEHTGSDKYPYAGQHPNAVTGPKADQQPHAHGYVRT